MFGTTRSRVALLGALLLLTAACTAIPDAERERAEQAEAQVSALQVDLATAQFEAATTASTVAVLESEVAGAQADLRDMQTMLTATEGTLERLEAENASMLGSLADLNEQHDLALATLRQLVEAVCQGVDTEPPAALPDSLRRWLEQTESQAGDVPDDLGVTITDAAGRDGWWVFSAEFSARFQPGVFLQDADGGFRNLWGGFASTEVELWAYRLQDNPDVPPGLVTCLDLSPFDED